MYLTVDILEKYGACGSGVKWFKRHYPEGGELMEVIQNPKIDTHTLHWGYEHLPTTEEEKAKYRELLHIECGENYRTIYKSNNVKDSSFVTNSKDVVKSMYVFNCEGVENSNSISFSQGVQNSSQIFHTDFCYDSNRILNSQNITNCRNLINCNYAVSSTSVFNAGNVVNSSFVSNIIPLGSQKIRNSHFISDCSNLKNCLFCHGITDGEYLMFNQPIEKEEYDMFVTQLRQMLKGAELKLTKNGWSADQVPLEAPNIQYNIILQYSALPEVFWRWVKTLPNYDPMILYNITMQPHLLTD